MTIYQQSSEHHPKIVERSFFYLRRRLANALVLVVFDGAAWALAFSLCTLVAHQLTGQTFSLGILGTASLFWFLGGILAKLYPGWGKGVVEELRLTTEIAVISVVLTLLAYFFTEHNVVRALPLLLLLTSVPLLALGRNFAKRLCIQTGIWGVPVVIYGAAKTGQKLAEALKAEPGMGYQPIGFFDDNTELHHQKVAGLPVLGDTSHQDVRSPIAILAMPGSARERNVELLEGSLRYYRRVLIIPDLFDVQSLWATTRDLGGVLGLEISRNLHDPIAKFMKRSFDVLAVLISAPLWVPVCLLVALAIWLEDRGNPLFLQERLGRGGTTFKTWKFRTMFPDAEAVLQRKLAEDPALKAEWDANFKLKVDPRITRVGAILRKTSLDEFPQLINVLLGDMSLVGPRPLPRYHYVALPEKVQNLREDVRPGMTGLWQVSGRSDSGNAGMEIYDPYYVRNWSIWLDLVILVRTVRVVLFGSGAY